MRSRAGADVGVRTRAWVGVGLVVLLLATLCSAVGAGAAGAALPRVTLFGDSVAASLTTSAEGRAAITSGYDLVLDAEVCRRLVAPSCAYQGFTPPTVLQAVQARTGAQLGKLVVVDVGYNDLASRYSADLDAVMAALVAPASSTWSGSPCVPKGTSPPPTSRPTPSSGPLPAAGLR